jgi:hypothetical protein
MLRAASHGDYLHPEALLAGETEHAAVLDFGGETPHHCPTQIGLRGQ